MIKKILLLLATVALVVAGAVLVSGATAQASVPGESAASNLTAIPLTRVVNTPGGALNPGQDVTVQVAGVKGIPDNATLAVGRLIAYNTAHGESAVVWDGKSGAPGTPTVISGATTVAHPSGASAGFTSALTNGRLKVHLLTGSGRFLMEINAYGAPAPAPVAAPQTVFDATTVMTNRTDSGKHGDWATDLVTRQAHLNDQGATQAANCNGLPNCHFFTGTLTDTGAFTTLEGAHSPEAGAAIAGVVKGQISGAEQVEFYANTRPSSAAVPANLSGNAVSTSAWFKQFFNGGFVSDENEITWGWTYLAPALCNQWANTKAGDQGDITGVNECGDPDAAQPNTVTKAFVTHNKDIKPAFICPDPRRCRFVA